MTYRPPQKGDRVRLIDLAREHKAAGYRLGQIHTISGVIFGNTYYFEGVSEQRYGHGVPDGHGFFDSRFESINNKIDGE